MKTITSIISNVTVFKDRAQVFRIGTIKVSNTEQVIRFENLPASIDKNSIQVNGKGNAVLKNIKFQEIFTAEITDDRKRELENKANEVKLSIKEISDKIENAGKEKEFVQSVANKIVDPTHKSKSEFIPETWMKMTDFYRSRLDVLLKEIRDTGLLLKKEVEKLNKINKEIAQAGNLVSKYTNVVDVTIISKEETDIKLYLSYIVYGASWKPVYNVRVSSENKKLALEYNSTIRQNTGEDWNDIYLQLSTAQVQVGGNIPLLSPWNIEVYRYIPIPKSFSKKKERAKLAKVSDKMDTFGALEECAEELDMPIEAMLTAPVSVEEKATSSVFTTGGKYTILSDNLDYSATILLTDFDSEFNYSCVPKLTPYAFLKAKTKNNTDFPLLPGQLNVFFDNSFVAESKLKLVLSDEEFDVSLGVDESIKIEYKLLKKYNKHEGVFNKKIVIIYEYETKIKNTKKTDENITLLDHIPVSLDEEIKVELDKPKYKTDTDSLKINKQGIITRIINIKKGEELKIPLIFSVEYPRDTNVTGL